MRTKFLFPAILLSAFAGLFTFCAKETAETQTVDQALRQEAADRDICCYFKYKTNSGVTLDVYDSWGGGVSHPACTPGLQLYHAGQPINGYPMPCGGNHVAHFHRNNTGSSITFKVTTTTGSVGTFTIPAGSTGIDVYFNNCNVLGSYGPCNN